MPRQSTAVLLTCEHCATTFTVKPSQSHLRFCSLPCYWAWGRAHGPSLADRFWAKVRKAGPNECWLWLGSKNKRGYGKMTKGGSGRKLVYVTHVSWFLAHGVWPEKFMLHECDNPSCVNPGHLFEGDALANNRDAARKGRNSHGERRPNAKLTEDQVAEIRRRYIPYHPVHGGAAMAREFGVGSRTVNDIVRGRNWKHVAR